MLLSVTNKLEVQRQIKRNRLLFWLGVLGLVASMSVLVISAGDPTLAGLVFLVGYPFLILGLVASKRGAFNNRRHGIGGLKIKSEADQLAETLEGVPTRFHLYNWIKLGGTAIDHLLVTPQGLMIIQVKSQIGDVKASNDRYYLKKGMTGWFATLGEPGLGNPSRELGEQVKKVRAWFEAKGYELPTDGVVVFMNPRTKILSAEEMSFPVCKMGDLKLAVRGWETELSMTVAEQQEVEDQLIQALPAEVAEEARALAQMPGYKRVALLQQSGGKDKSVAVKEKPKVEEAPKPRLTPEERDRLRLERIRAAEEKGRQPVNPYAQPELGKRVGMDGKVREDKSKVIEKKPARRRVEPLRKAPPGAFGEISGASSKKK